ncbi:hypothetical protein BGZ95_004152 [Linnemannia exigua]|uniref:Uncharacterized protein n=1 Tax=Linnemannia exigua TaxID=604196 RepID=A0AAD4D3C3_9FUNG|nr:hypothetical protein BGZ95_004152 [Linnemannia exigua]
MTTSVIRTVDKKGGLDRYLLETRDDLLGAKGVELRGKVIEALKIKQAKRSMENFSARERSTVLLSTEANEAVKAATQKVDPSAPVINTSAYFPSSVIPTIPTQNITTPFSTLANCQRNTPSYFFT